MELTPLAALSSVMKSAGVNVLSRLKGGGKELRSLDFSRLVTRPKA